MCFFRSIVITWVFEFCIERFLVQWFSSTWKAQRRPLLRRSVEGQCPQASSLTCHDRLVRQWAVRQHPLPYHERKIMIHFFLKPAELLLHAWGKQQRGKNPLPELLLLLLSPGWKNKNLLAAVTLAVEAPGIFQQKLNFRQKQTYMAIIWGHWCYPCILQV